MVIRQDSAFYVNSPSAETVWEEKGNRFFVVRNGEMRIHAKKNADDEHTEVIRYTDALLNFGIQDEFDLLDWQNKGEEVFCWVNNSWFEIWDSEDTDFFSDPIHSLNEAIELAEKLNKEGVVA
jgi:hypothetical protein